MFPQAVADGRWRSVFGSQCIVTTGILYHYMDVICDCRCVLCHLVLFCSLIYNYTGALALNSSFFIFMSLCHIFSLAVFPRLTYGKRFFVYAGPAAWNSLREHLQTPHPTLNSFKCSLKLVKTHKWQIELGTCESEIFVQIESRIQSAATIWIWIKSGIESGRSHLHVQCRLPQELSRRTAYCRELIIIRDEQMCVFSWFRKQYCTIAPTC